MQLGVSPRRRQYDRWFDVGESALNAAARPLHPGSEADHACCQTARRLRLAGLNSLG